MMRYRMLADLIVIVHAAYVGFVVIGFVLILAGVAAGWEWVRNFWFRAAHLAAIGLVCAESALGIICPLTGLENSYREIGGERGYAGDFIAHWASRIIFYDAPPWMFAVGYFGFGAIVIVTFLLAPPRMPSMRGHRNSETGDSPRR
jgi:hypothetical protein